MFFLLAGGGLEGFGDCTGTGTSIRIYGAIRCIGLCFQVQHGNDTAARGLLRAEWLERRATAVGEKVRGSRIPSTPVGLLLLPFVALYL